MSKLAPEEMTACPTCGDLTFNTGDCFHCLAIAQSKTNEPAPIDMLIFCPSCGKQHIDQPEPKICKCTHHRYDHRATNGKDDTDPYWCGECDCKDFKIGWTNPSHKSHKCHLCGTVWRPADVPTNGVASIQTRGKADTWPRDPAAVLTARPIKTK